MLAFIVFFPILSAFIAYIIGKKNKTARDYFTWIVTAVVLAASISLTAEQTYYIEGFCSLGVSDRKSVV